MELTASQRSAVDVILDRVKAGKRVVTLSGAAGTGKTTILDHIRRELDDVVVCTPTNKAAQVLLSKGIEAATFYKRFYILEEQGRQAKPRFISCRRTLETFAANKFDDPSRWIEFENKLPDGKRAFAKRIIVDEASMLTTRAVTEMLSMCETLILVGDRHQLPPVGDSENPAGYFASIKPDAELTEVLRQAEGSLILQLANEIRQGSTRVDKMLRHFEPQDTFADWMRKEARILAFTNRERQRINMLARRLRGTDSGIPVPGDRVIVTNNYSDDFINGTEALVTAFNWDGQRDKAYIGLKAGDASINTSMRMSSFIEDQVSSYQEELGENLRRDTDEENLLELTYGYAMTAHKAQGSEWPAVAVMDQRSVLRKVAMSDRRSGMPPDEYVRRWLYTAVTRARRDLTFAPTWWAQTFDRGEFQE